MINRNETLKVSRRNVLCALGAMAACELLPEEAIFSGTPGKPTRADEAFLDDLERQGSLFFWEQGSEKNGQILDRAHNDLAGKRDPRRMASIASTGFGLTVLCIADKRGYLPHEQVQERVRTTLNWHLNNLPEVHGFFYHFNDIETGKRWRHSELSSIDTSILLCGILTARAYFTDGKIQSLAQQIYERVDWPWFLNEGTTFSMGWHPRRGFLAARWSHYCELMMLYLLAIGSSTHPVPPDTWNNFTRPMMHYKGYDYISGNNPLFTHQYSQAWYDFRKKRDAYANYFHNSVTATHAHKAFCLSYPNWYSEDYWGVTSSDSAHGYVAWGGPPKIGPLDGTVVPCAAGGSLAFVPGECLAVLRAMRKNWGKRAWGRYGFVDAFHPTADWYDTDVIGIDQGISVLMAENLRSGLVWEVFMKNPECRRGMQLAGIKTHN